MEQSYRPDKDLRDATVVISSTTTSAGNAGGTTLVDTVLTQGNDYWNNMAVVILSGNSIGQIRRISDFTSADDTITVDTAFASQIASGTKYNIVAQHTSTGSGMASTDAGVRQVIEVSVTSAANAGAVTLATVSTQPCMIESIVIHADAAQTTDLTSCPITGGASGVITFISAGIATQANLSATSEQVSWTGTGSTGPVRLPVAATIVITLNGTGATAVDLTVTITHYASVSGGTLS